MIKPGYSLVVAVAPPRGISTNQCLVAPSRGTKNNQGPYRLLQSPFTPSTPHPPETRGWRPAIQLDSELN